MGRIKKPLSTVIDLENEVWMPVVGYENTYAVSCFGRIKMIGKSWINNGIIKKRGERLLNPFLNRGYYRVSLLKDGDINKYAVHRLVCQAFYKNPKNKTQVNHKNGNKLDNKSINLEWVTPSENQLHAHKTGLKVAKSGSDSPNSKRILCTTLGLEYSCGVEAANSLGLSESSVKRVANNVQLHTQGLVFRFI